VGKMNTRNLWSALIRNQTKSEIFCPSDLKVTIEELFEELKRLIQSNDIPASIDLNKVTWDDTDLSQTRIIIRYSGKDIPEDDNVIQFLVGLDRLGNYTYIEEKVFFDKPKLPVFPREIDKTPKPEAEGCFVWVGLLLFLIPGIIYLIYIGNKQTEYEETVVKNNEKAKEEQKAWNDAWAKWESKVFNVSYLGSTDDVYGRFVQAISSLVKMSIKTLFEDKKAEIKERVEKEFTEKQLKDELEKRKAAFK